MKKLFIIFLSLIFVLFIGCKSEDENTPSKNEKGVTYVWADLSYLDLNDSQINFIKEKFKQKIYDINDKKCDIKFIDYRPKSDDIKDFDLYCEFISEIKYRDNNLISIAFDSMYNDITAAHPYNFFYTLNFNPDTLDMVYFKDKYIINENLYYNVLNTAKDDLRKESGIILPQETDIYIQMYSVEDFLNGLEQEYSSMPPVYCYYTKDGVGFSYEVSHAMGAHREIELSFNKLEIKDKK